MVIDNGRDASVVIRRADPKDRREARAILEVHRRAVHVTAAAAYPKEILDEWGTLPITEQSVDRFVADKGCGEIILVAVEGGGAGEIVGFSEIVPGGEELRAVYVDPERGRAGVGTALLAAIEAEARRNGCLRLELHASVNALRFYERNGYLVLRADDHPLRSGRKMPCFLMEKRWEPAPAPASASAPRPQPD